MEEIKLPDEQDSKIRSFQPKAFLRAVPPRLSFAKSLPLLIIVLVVAAGIFSGLVLSSRNKASQQAASAIEEEELSGEQKESFAQTFRDEAEGVIEKNEYDQYAQGTHKLIRPGGESQTAYLTSSVLDLNEYVGKKVKVFGETFSSSEVGWLMDVGKIEVTE